MRPKWSPSPGRGLSGVSALHFWSKTLGLPEIGTAIGNRGLAEAIGNGFSLKALWAMSGRSTPDTTGSQESIKRYVEISGEGRGRRTCTYMLLCPVTHLFSSRDVLQTRTGKYGKGSGMANRIHLPFQFL